jgi:hypothetical protein
VTNQKQEEAIDPWKFDAHLKVISTVAIAVRQAAHCVDDHKDTDESRQKCAAKTEKKQ